MSTDVGIRALQQTASKVVARVESGETLTITDRGRPVARLVPIAASPLEQLIAEGAARPARVTWAEVPEPMESDVHLGDLLWAARADER